MADTILIVLTGALVVLAAAQLAVSVITTRWPKDRKI